MHIFVISVFFYMDINTSFHIFAWQGTVQSARPAGNSKLGLGMMTCDYGDTITHSNLHIELNYACAFYQSNQHIESTNHGYIVLRIDPVLWTKSQ